ncbi:MAG TPA: agmatinase [Chloroflexota bacterium]|nr:agmatinase [Chloroflexota bacterium]
MRPSFAPPATRFLASSPEGLQRATAALFGAPLDLTESFRSGTRGGPAAVRVLSEVLETYSPVLDRDLGTDARVVDLGNVVLDSCPMEEALERIASAMAYAAATARLGVMLGGEHTGSLGGFRGIRRVYPRAQLLHVDAHLDIRPEYEGQPTTHATWLHRLGDDFGFEVIHQVGVRSGDQHEWQLARQRTSFIGTELALPGEVRARLAEQPLYVSIDIDVLDPAQAPGTGCPEPGGYSFRELAAFLYGLGGLPVVGLDVMEVSPDTDPAGITAAAAAKLVREAVLLFS